MYPLRGWAAPDEGSACTWSVGDSSKLRTSLSDDWPRDGTTFLELELHPYVNERRARQRLRILVNGWAIANETLEHPCALGYPVPQAALASATELVVELLHPDAHSPAAAGESDTRILAMCVHSVALVSGRTTPQVQATRLPAVMLSGRDGSIDAQLKQLTGVDRLGLASGFESLGHSCEFGLVQFHLGVQRESAENGGLFRFAGVELASLTVGLRRGFADLGLHIDVSATPGADGLSDLILTDLTYRISTHSFRKPTSSEQEQLRKFGPRFLRMRWDRLRAQLEGGEHVFVFMRPGELRVGEIRPLLTMIRAYGSGALLFVDNSPRLAHGEVEMLEHGLFHGKLDEMAPPHEAGASDVPGWISVLANTHLLWARHHRSANES